ncbi:MAG: alpha/beta hydrolase [Mobilitalea sp.]
MKKTRRILIISLALIILGSFFASMFNTSMFSVKVKEIEFKTERGTLSGLLYMPKGASAEDPRPVIVTTHGYLNTKEMQDAPAIELSRRGYIVLALDMYDHGDSRWDGDIAVGDQFGTFWIYSQFDAATYMAKQDYTKKDENGNAYLAVSGHSMGGFSTLIAVYMDEMASLTTGTRSIYTALTAGADYSYAAAVASETDYIAAFGDRTIGMIAAHYDEFFFNKSDEEKTAAEKKVTGTVTYKDFAATLSGKQFLGITDLAGISEAEKFYTVESGDLLYDGNVVRASQTGQHIIYTPNQTHPWNHFSKTTTGDMINFYHTAFEGVTSSTQTNVNMSSDNQIWFMKELFNLIALIGFFLSIVPIITLLLKAPFLKLAVTEEIPAVAAPVSGRQKIVSWITIAICGLYPAVLFSTFMDKTAAGLNVLTILGIIAAVGGIVLAILGSTKKKPALVYSGIAAAVVSGAAALVFKLAPSIVALSAVFNEPTTNQVVYWAISCGLIALVITIMYFALSKQKAGTAVKDYGVSLNVKAILASLCVALLTIVCVYLLLFAVQAIFGTDYRIWTLAVRTFKLEHVLVALRYLPLFFIYYFINTIAVNANTRGKKGGYAIAIFLNIGGLLLWLLLQYGLDFARGVALFPAQSLNGILLIATVPCLGVAAVFAKKIFEKTNNVWLASFVNSMLFTMIMVANTAMFWNMV